MSKSGSRTSSNRGAVGGAGDGAPRAYRHNPVHRDGTRGKTQWHVDVTVQMEEAVFRYGESKGWLTDQDSFSVKTQDAAAGVAYIDVDHVLNFAHFTGDSVWHGWPANPKRSPHDLPPYAILAVWIKLKFTTRARVAKLRRFQRCSI